MDGALGSAFLAGAGLVAGFTGTAGGVTPLAAYPALLAVDVPPLAAHAGRRGPADVHADRPVRPADPVLALAGYLLVRG